MKDTFIKYIGFAETLFKGKNSLPAEKSERQVNKTVQNVLFLHAINRFNHGGYVVNLSNHIHN